jgi:PAS domain S-box-containing protein
VTQPSMKRSETEVSFHDLVDAITDYAIFRLDAEGRIASWNPGASRVKGYSAGEAIGQHFSIFYTAEDRALGRPEQILQTVRQTGRFEEEGWRVRKDGSRFWAGVTITPLRDEAGQILGFAKVTRDLTERREAEETERQLAVEHAARVVAERTRDRLEASQRAAEAAAKRAEESNRLKDEFLATVSHELRTPLNAILGWAAIIKSRTAGTPLAAGAEAICRNAEAQARLIEDILDVSRIITGKLRLVSQEVDLVAVIDEALQVVQPSANAKSIRLSFVHEEPSIKLLGDAERLRQVAWNLLSNAIKFTPQGGSVQVSLEANVDGRALFRVRDTGQGIATEFLPYVFDRFRQEEGGTTRRMGGLGLGLAIVRHIVELHGGTVSVDSRGPGQGASFEALFPIPALASAADAREALGSAVAPAGPSERLDGIKVLVVDDDQDARALLTTALTDVGADVTAADSAEQGFESYLRVAPRVVVSDIAMPDEDGYSLAERIRAHQAGGRGATPLIALSAFTRNRDKERARRAGFSAYLTKPVSASKLITLIAEVSLFDP